MESRTDPANTTEATSSSPRQTGAPIPTSAESDPTTISEGIVLYRSAMTRTFGLLFYLLGLGFLLRNLRMEDHSSDRIRRASAIGPVVYVLQNRSILDLLSLNMALNAQRLPLADFANGVRLTPFLPLSDVFSSVARRLSRWRQQPLQNPVSSGFLTSVIGSGHNASLFLSSVPLRWRWLLRRSEPDPIPALLEAQRLSSRAVQVVPVVVVWSRAPLSTRSEVGRFLLGNEDVPGFFGKIWAGLTRTGQVLIQAGEAVDLQRYLTRDPEAPLPRQIRVLRLALSRYLYREQTIIRGPRMRSPGWMKRLVVQNPEVRAAIRKVVQEDAQPEARVLRRVERLYDRIAARFSFTLVLLACSLTNLVWERIYSGVDLRRSDFDLVRQALRRGTPVLVPCHRSHIDYLLLSSVLFRQDIVIPHIVAGINLSFWPMGAIFRRLGAFFIKRSFTGDHLFPAVFSAYLGQLVRDGFPLEFFIEGGRSRTGKMLPPKLGVLGMIMDAASQTRREDFDVTFLPVNICYEQIAEENAYARELAGEKKKDESFKDVARVPRVLRSRFGRVYLRIGEPISANEILETLPGPWAELNRERRQEVLGDLGEQILHRINEQAVVLPTSLVAAALLAQTRRGIRRETLLSRTRRFRMFLEKAGIEASATLENPEWALEQALKRFLASKKVSIIEDESGPIYRITDEGRSILDYYKNTVLQPFVPASLLALAIRLAVRERPDALQNGAKVPPVVLQDVLPTVQTLMYLFRYEFIFDTEATEDIIMERAVSQLIEHGALQAEGQGFTISDSSLLTEIAELTANFVESYWVVVRTARSLRGRSMDREAVLQAIHKMGRGMLAVDELRRTESLSMSNLRNALRVFTEDNLIRFGQNGESLKIDETLCKDYLSQLGALLEG